MRSCRLEGSKEEQQNCTFVASHRTPSTGALEYFCEFFSCMQLEYCLREPLSKFEGLSTFDCNFINVNILYCIYGTFGPFLLHCIRTTVRIIVSFIFMLCHSGNYIICVLLLFCNLIIVTVIIIICSFRLPVNSG